MDKYTSWTVLLISVLTLIVGSVYYLIGEPYVVESSYIVAWLMSATGFLIYIAYKPRKKK